MARLERLVRVHPYDARAPLALPAMLYFVFGHFRLILDCVCVGELWVLCGVWVNVSEMCDTSETEPRHLSQRRGGQRELSQ